MSTWEQLCMSAAFRAIEKQGTMLIGLDEFDKIRAVMEAADKYADTHEGPEGYKNWKTLVLALDALGVGTEGGGDDQG